jgi:endonuclease III
MNADERQQFFAVLRDLNPHPTTELAWRNHFELLIAVMLSAQSTDVAVNKVTRHLFAEAADAAAMHELGEAGIRRHIASLGLFNAKARNVWLTCGILLAQYQGEVPDQREALEALPGVGRKTANVVLNTAFGQNTMAVDTHIFRVANRTGLAPGKTPLAVELALLKRVPEEFLRDAHHWLILHGRYVCKARAPRCGDCAVIAFCRFRDRFALRAQQGAEREKPGAAKE